MMGPGFDGGFFGGMPPFFMLFFLFVFGFIIFVIISMAKNYHKNATSPILTQHAKVVAKRTKVSHHHSTSNNNMHHSSHTYYYATFETDAGQRIELIMSGRDYGMLAEGDLGELTYQGEWFKQFKREFI